MSFTYSLHKIDNAQNFGFLPDDYSRFKFGDDAVAREFGTSLARGFIRDYLRLAPVHQQLVVISSPYSFIPTATFAMKNYFVYELNHWLAENGYPVVQEAKVHRTVTYKEDYGALSAEDRLRLIGNDSFHIDKGFVEGKMLLFLDDIRITGSHEKMIRKMAQAYNLDNEMAMLYFAELVNAEIDPVIENHLNYHKVKSIFDLHDIINSGSFFINTRIVKYILNYEHASFCLFLQNQTDNFIRELYNMALGNGYHLMESYVTNLNHIKQQLFKNNQTLINYGN